MVRDSEGACYTYLKGGTPQIKRGGGREGCVLCCMDSSLHIVSIYSHRYRT